MPDRSRPSIFRTAFAAFLAALPVAAAATAPARAEIPHEAPDGAPHGAPDEVREEAAFDLSLRGIRAGSFLLSSGENPYSYTAAAYMSGTGLAGLLVSVRYDARVQGLKHGGGRLGPTHYEADIDSGRRETRTLIEYPGGAPEVLMMVSDPPREASDTPVDPATQGDALDPLTAIWLAMRPMPVADACAFDLAVFDGLRRSGFRHTEAEWTGEELVCEGEYRRIAGFSPEDMAEREVFPVRLVYRPVPGDEADGNGGGNGPTAEGGFGGGMVHLVEATIDSRFGAARLRRR